STRRFREQNNLPLKIISDSTEAGGGAGWVAGASPAKPALGPLNPRRRAKITPPRTIHLLLPRTWIHICISQVSRKFPKFQNRLVTLQTLAQRFFFRGQNLLATFQECRKRGLAGLVADLVLMSFKPGQFFPGYSKLQVHIPLLN